MGERPPARYEPGELDRTRKNLGRLTPEEAKKMTSLLGGDLGVEKADSKIEERYRTLKDMNRRRSDSATAPYRAEREKAEARSRQKSIPVPGPAPEPAKPGFFTAVRMAFLASRPEHGLIRRRDAWFLLLFPFLKTRLYINPSFLKTGDRLFYNHIERFVLSVRSLLARNRRFALYRIKPGYYRSILYVYRNWNIETLHIELSRLQAKPREAYIRSASRLFRELFRPFMILSEIDRDIETEKALKYLFDLTLLSVPKDGKEAGIIKELYITARNEIYHVTSRIHRQCWPLLPYLVGTGYDEYSSFFTKRKGDILSFLGLEEKDLVLPPRPAGEDKEDTPPEETAEAAEEAGDLTVLQETAGNHGLSILADLFPDSGWDCAETWPDLIPYFKPICSLPKGADILSPEDSLHQAVVLAAIASELCSGFRGMRFTGDGENDSVGETLERLSFSWHVILDEVLAKHYIAPLTEYCRQYERDPDFSDSRYAEKIQSELYWIKRNYLTPYSYTGAFKGSRPGIRKKLPKLFETAADMAGILSRVLLSGEGDGRPLLENPDDPFHFEVPGYIPLRIKAVLQRRKEPVSNLNLVTMIHGVVSALDYLVNNPESWFYGSEEKVIFRGDCMQGTAPVYSIDALDTPALIRSWDEKSRKASAEQQQETFGGLKDAEHFVREQIETGASGVLFRMKKDPEAGESRMLGTFIHRRVREWVDQVYIVKEGFILLILPDTGIDDACALACRLIHEIREHSESLFSPGAAVFTFPPDGPIKELLQSAGRAAGGTTGTVVYRDDEKRWMPAERDTGPLETSINDVE